MTNTVKDPMIKFRSVMRGKNSKGGDRTQLYISQEDATTLIETLTANLDNPKGIKIDLHVTKKEHEGRSFDSAIAFVKAVQDMGAAKASQPTSFKPKAAPSDMQAKIAALKAQQIKA